MSLRRHRIKPTANLANLKRKLRNDESVIVQEPEKVAVIESQEEHVNNVLELEIDRNVADEPIEQKLADYITVEAESIHENATESQENRALSFQLQEPMSECIHDMSVPDSTALMHNFMPCKDEIPTKCEKVPAEREFISTARDSEYCDVVDSPVNSNNAYYNFDHGALPINTFMDEDLNEGHSKFKAPPPTNMNTYTDVVIPCDLQNNVIQMDLQKPLNDFAMSPSKMQQARQRVRPTPMIGQRRNSFACASPLSQYSNIDLNDTAISSLEFQTITTPRRERYLSSSSTKYHQVNTTPTYQQSINNAGTFMHSRIRTESTCSAFSDFSISGKTRKTDEQKQLQRLNARRDFEMRFNQGVPEKTAFKMSDLIYYNPITNPMDRKPVITTIKNETIDTDTKPARQEFEPKIEPVSMPVPQLKLNANGEMIIDEKTLEIETTAELEARKVLATSSLIVLDENTGMNGFYKRKKRTRGWSSEETVRFYRSLQIIGTDFTLMCQLFPNRTRRDLKLKFKKEERENEALINKALLYPKAFKVKELQQELEKEDREREEAEQKWKEIKAREVQRLPRKEPKRNASKATRTLRHGDFVYHNENVVVGKMGKISLAKKPETSASDSMEQNAKRHRQRNRYHHNEINMPNRTEGALPAFATIKQEAMIKVEQNSQTKISEYCNTDALVLEAEINELLKDQIEVRPPVESNENAINNRMHEIVNVVNDQMVNKEFYEWPVAPAMEIIISNENETENQVIETLLTAANSPALDHNQMTTTTNNAPADNDAQSVDVTAVDDLDGVSDIVEYVTNEEDENMFVNQDIQGILRALEYGNLVLVTSVEPGSDGKVINEIFEVQRETGELCDQPLNIPNKLVNCILAVMDGSDP